MKFSTGTWVLLAAIAGSGMTFIDGTAVNVALPTIQADLHSDASSLQWVIEGYTLFLSALILVGGSLGDLYGRRFLLESEFLRRLRLVARLRKIVSSSTSLAAYRAPARLLQRRAVWHLLAQVFKARNAAAQ